MLSPIARNIHPLHSSTKARPLADQAPTLNHQLESAISRNDSAVVTTLLQSHAEEELSASTRELIITTLMSSAPDTPDLAMTTILTQKLMGDKFSVDDPIHEGKSLKDIAQHLYKTTGNNQLLRALDTFLPKKYDSPLHPATPERFTSFAGDLETPSTDTCNSSPFSSPPYPTPLRRSLSAGTLPFPKFDDDDYLTPPKEKPQYRQPIHNRGISLIEGRVTDSVANMLRAKQQQTGKVITNNHIKSQQGNGSGILIAPNLFLTSRHCIQKNNHHSVVFGAHEAGMKGEVFAVLKTHAADSEIAQQHGLICGAGGDFIILELANSPGKIYGYTPLKIPTTLDGATELYFLGYSAGSHLKMSEMAMRPRKLTDFIKRCGHKLQALTNKLLFWNNGKTHGVIQDAKVIGVNAYADTADKVALKVTSPTRNRRFTVQNTTVLRERDEVANRCSEFYVGLPIQIGHDHIKTGHHASNGSSGGIYFTQDGTIYAVQRGMIATDPKHPDHLAYFPWCVNFIDFYDDQLILENKKKGLKPQTAARSNIQSQTTPQITPSLPLIKSKYTTILQKEAEHKANLVIEKYRQADAGEEKTHALHVLNAWLYPKKIDPKRANIQSYWDDIHHDLLEGANTQFKKEADAQFERIRRSRQDIALGNRRAIAGSKENYCILDVGVWSWGVNQAFIEGGAFRGARFWLETAFPEAIWERFSITTMDSRTFLEAIKPLPDTDPSHISSLWHSGEDRPSWYALEVAGLLDLGYVLRQEQGKNYLMLPQTSSSLDIRSISSDVSKIGYQTYLKSIN